MSPEAILEVIVRCTREIVPELESHAFERTDRFADLGANSLDRAEIVAMVLETLSLNVPRTQLFGPQNVGELADLLFELFESAPAK